MIELFNKKNKNNKEYIKFENGKVVSVDDTESLNQNNNAPINSFSDLPKESSNDNPKVKKVKNLLKPVLIISLFVGGFFVINDIHKTFYETPGKNQVSQKQINKDIKPSTPVQNNTTQDKEKNTTSESDKNLSSSVYSDITYLTSIDASIIKMGSEEIDFTNGYMDKSINYPTLYDRMTESIALKTNMLKELNSKDDFLNNNGYKDFKNVLKERINRAIIMNTEIKDALENIKGTPALINSLNKYVEDESKLKATQNSEFIKLLDSKKIKYHKENTGDNIVIDIK